MDDILGLISKDRLLRLGRNAWQDVIALLAASLAVLLVPALCLSMAFFEYQSRLLRYQPGISAAEIMDALRREIEFKGNEASEAESRKELTEATRALSRAEGEVRFLADRVCSLFPRGTLTDEQLAARYGRCLGFLFRVPYDGTIGSSIAFDPRGDDLGHDARWRKFEEVVLANFGVEMTGPGNAAGISQYLPMMNRDIVRIARLNQEIVTEHRLKRDLAQRAVLDACVRNVELQIERTDTSGFGSNCAQRAGYDVATLAAGPVVGKPLPDPSPPPSIAPSGAGEAPDPAATEPAPDPAPPAPPPPDAAPAQPTPPKGDGQRPVPQAGGRDGGVVTQPLRGSPPTRSITDPDRIEKLRRYELIRQLEMYDIVSWQLARKLVLTPPDFLAMFLLVIGGALGAMLKILFRHLAPAESVGLPDLLLEPAKGLICAVLLFILLRSGFAVVSANASLSPEGAALSPFFVAFLAVGAGLMSDQVIRAVRATASSFIGQSGRLHPNRWAVGLDAAMNAAPMSSKRLAERLGGIAEERVDMWRQMKEPVDSEYQDRISLLLDVPAYRMFTDMPPPEAEAPAAPTRAPADPGPAPGAPAPA